MFPDVIEHPIDPVMIVLVAPHPTSYGIYSLTIYRSFGAHVMSANSHASVLRSRMASHPTRGLPP